MSSAPNPRRYYRLPAWLSAAFVAAVCFSLVLLLVKPVQVWTEHNHLPLHALLEVASVSLSTVVFALGWTVYRQHGERHILYLACAFLGVAVLDLSHLLSFMGMPDYITGNSVEKSIAFWLAARYVAAVGLLIVVWQPWPNSRDLPKRRALGSDLALPLGVVLAFVVLVHVVILHAPQWLPRTYFPDTGLTPFKIVAEYGVVVLNAAALLVLFRRMPKSNECNAHLLASALIVMVISELLFTAYIQISGTAMFLGHLYKVIAFFLLYLAVDIGQRQPPPERVLLLENSLQYAVRNNQLSLVFQPQCRASDGRLIGAEVLVRWHHPKLGPISPVEFIPIAEKCGLMPEIGEWVLRSAVAQITAWVRQGYPPTLTFSVNLSVVQFRYPLLATKILQLLKEFKLPSHYLGLEITESVAMDDAELALRTLDRLRREGISLALDDFGTGHSSLSHLKQLNVNLLKIDQSFIRSLAGSPADQEIVRAIVYMAHSLGMQTVAEGVETAAQLDALKKLGCDQVQGYLFSKPLSASEFNTFVVAHEPLLSPSAQRAVNAI